MDRNCLDKEGQKKGPKLNLAARGWGKDYVIIHMCPVDPNRGRLEELNTASTPESGVQAAVTRSTRMFKKRQVNSVRCYPGAG